uniref:Uncharacterized protein n=1 Tax=Tanacetum cinerariifolium TaxID=118510 RepID=A0A6L2LCT3_TANCI|nr:hypothetical protein [Tanacetum cinerariifolium]
MEKGRYAVSGNVEYSVLRIPWSTNTSYLLDGYCVLSFISPACRRTHCNHTVEDDLEVFSTDDFGLDWISAHNFLTCLHKLSSYTFGHLEVSELASCLKEALFFCTPGHRYVSLHQIDSFDSAGESIGSSPSLVILSNTKAEVLAIHVVLPEITPKAAAAAAVVAPPTATPDLGIESDLEVEHSEASPSEAPPSPDYVPSSLIHAPASLNYHPESDIKSEQVEDESEPIEDALEATEPQSA